MIIIKTANGDNFINEKETHLVQHDKANSQVIIRSAKDGLNCIISNVECIIYTNDAQPVHWQDEGSAMQRMQKSLDEHREVIDKQRTEILAIEQERDELKTRLAEFEERPIAEYENDRLIDKLYHEIDRLDLQEREDNRKKYPDWGVYQKRGTACRFINVAKAHDIETVGQLLAIGRVQFERFHNMGRLCADRISEALGNLYGIKSW